MVVGATWITTGIDVITGATESLITLITANAVLSIFLAASILGIGIKTFRKLAHK